MAGDLGEGSFDADDAFIGLVAVKLKGDEFTDATTGVGDGYDEGSVSGLDGVSELGNFGGGEEPSRGVLDLGWHAPPGRGASAYRLDWNGLSVVWTGDGRPSELDLEFAEGVDLYITETQPELIAISSGVQGVPPFLGRYTVDTHHTPSYATGYLASQINPRLLMTTHMPFDAYVNEETVAEIREHWKGPFHFGAPDGIVVNVTKDDIWVREGVLPQYPNMRAPQQDFTDGALVVPVPNQKRVDMQDPFVREKEIDPALYYPDGYHPELMTEWPVDSDLVVPIDVLPESMFQSMGENWRDREAYAKHISELSADS